MEKPTAVALPDDPNYNDESRDTPVPPAHAAAAGGEDDQQDTKQHITTTIYSTTTKGEKETMDVKEDKEHQTEGGEQQEEEPEMDFDLSCHDQLVEELMDKNPSLDTIKNLVTNDGGAGGKDAVLHQDNDGFNVLHYACRKNMSFEVIELLVQVGGKDIVLQQDEDGENSLHLACANKHISFEVIELLVNVGGKDAVLQQDNDGENAIMLVETYYACRNEYISFKIIEILVKVGGKQAVLHQDNDGFNALHYACRKNMSFEVIELLVQVGGKDVIVAPDDDGFNALYHACANKHISLEVIELLVRVGGNDVVLQQDEDGKNALHLAIQKELDYKIIDFFVKVGEHDAILAQDNDGFNALHYACEKKCSIKIIKRLVKGGGRNAILGRTLFGQNPLHIACKYNETDIEVVKYLVEQAGEEIETKMLEVDPESIYEASIRVGKERAVLERTDDEDRRNTIEVALDSNLSIETIKFLIDSVTSKEGILQKNAKDWNTLHSAVAGGTFTEEVYKLLIDKGGTDILKAETSEGKLPIDLCFSAPKFNYQAYSAITAKWLELDPKLYTVPNSVVNGMYKKRDVEISKSGDKLLDSDFFRGILNTFMIRHFSIIVLMMDLYAQTAIVGIVSFGSIGSCTSNTRTFVGFIVGLSLSVTWQLFREIMQESTTQFRKYVKDPYNWIDICQIVLIIMLIKDMCAINKREESLCYIASSRAILSLATIFAWLQFLIVWSDLSYNVSVFVAALFQISIKLVPFLFTTFIIVCGFTHAIHNASIGDEQICPHHNATDPFNDEQWMCSLPYAYFMTFTMFVSQEFDTSLLEEPSHVILVVVAFSFVGIVGILLLNILIAVVSNVFQRVQLGGQKAFWLKRLDLFIQLQSLMSKTLRSRIFKWINIKFGYEYEILVLEDSRISFKWKKLDMRRERNRTFKFFEDHKTKFFEDHKRGHPKRDKKFELFLKWFYDIDDSNLDTPTPRWHIRLFYYFSRASWDEIMFPGDEFEKLVLGIKFHDKVGKNLKWFPTHYILSYLTCLLSVVAVILVFTLGVVTFGLCWPTPIRSYLFHGPVTLKIDKIKMLRRDMSKLIEISQKELKAAEHELKSDKEQHNEVIKGLEADKRELIEVINQLRADKEHRDEVIKMLRADKEQQKQVEKHFVAIMEAVSNNDTNAS